MELTDQLISEQLTPSDVKLILRRLGIKAKGSGDKSIKSPLRDEKNASFSINLDTGLWKDFGTDDSGDIVTLTEQLLKTDTKDAIKWIKEQTNLAGVLYDPPKNGSYNNGKPKKAPKKFWTDDTINQLSDAQKRLANNPDHPVIQQAESYDCLEFKTLQFFGIGLIEKWGKDWLSFPYKTGCQLYRREDGKVIRSLRGSAPGQSFFGSRKITGDRDYLFIAKSPRECMLLFQTYGDRADVVGIATGEQSKLSTEQIEALRNEISASSYSAVQIFMDCDTNDAYNTAQSFCNGLATVLDQKINLINIYKSTGGAFKDITDCISAGMDDKTFQVMIDGAEVVQNANSAENATCNIAENQLDIATAPPIPNEVYNNLPELLKTLCSLVEDQHRRDVLLVSSLPAIASQMPNVKAEHRDCYYSPDIFTQIVAAPGSGKGDASKGTALASVTDEKIREVAQREIRAYEDLPDEEKAGTPKPKKRSLIIPANVSSRKMLDRLEANGGNGFVSESEIDTLINATKQDWGNYTDTVRKAFHHESLSIMRTDAEYYIRNPRLSVCLTGTFDQFKAMFESAENGHFSRYALYTFDAPRQWQSHRPTQNSRKLRDSVESASKRLNNMYRLLNKKNDPLYIDLTPEQWDAIDDTFSEKMQVIEDLGLSKHLHASNNRTGVIALRLASIFTVLRAYEDDPNRLALEKSLTPTMADMKAALLLADTFIKHAIRLYHILPEAKKNDTKGDRFQNFLNKLPEEFSTGKALEVGEQMDIPERTVKYWLSNDNNINKVKYGHYAKM